MSHCPSQFDVSSVNGAQQCDCWRHHFSSLVCVRSVACLGFCRFHQCKKPGSRSIWSSLSTVFSRLNAPSVYSKLGLRDPAITWSRRLIRLMYYFTFFEIRAQSVKAGRFVPWTRPDIMFLYLIHTVLHTALHTARVYCNQYLCKQNKTFKV